MQELEQARSAFKKIDPKPESGLGSLLGRLKGRQETILVTRLEVAFWQQAADNLHINFSVPKIEQILVENNGPESTDTVEVKLRFPLGVNMQKLQKEVTSVQALYD